MNTPVSFSKMNGIGNRIVVADLRGRADVVTEEAARALGHDPDTGFDQLMAIHDAGDENRDATIRIYNTDGSRAGACGNGTRCVVDWLHQRGGGNDFRFAVDGQPLSAKRLEDGRISVNMGVPRFDWTQIPLSEEFADTSGIELEVGPLGAPLLHTPAVANIGNPHCVFFAENDPDTYALDKFGPMLEHHMLFPDRANISIAQVTSPTTMKLRTWERGAGLTLACGSAACAAVVCAVRRELTERHVTVSLPGGDLDIEWRDDNFIIMTGTATHEFDGTFDPATGGWERA
ncbi:diaminopimelate epimerase [Ahrensia sp. R2A130]|uniref:diaminopimelate epimerase n=1 Tax=Ahrensia sp. R2A130 TaxID=744979 RepID=UPI0001E09C51|nr:diaminopimelate epimerase [Ahrensia sp. R2A130]EFL89635.1 diaminopimelate epimerase [Ahrensia sp. R2A130]